MTTGSLIINHLSYEYPHHTVFKKFSFAAHSGVIWQVLGANGSGKSTLLRLLAGALLPHAGDIVWNQRSLSKSEVRSEYQQQLFYLGASTGFKPLLTVRENLRFYGALRNYDQDNTTLLTALTHVGMEAFIDAPVHTLSTGQQRRVALAQLYLIKAKIWLLDEPFNALDSEIFKSLEQKIARHAASDGMVFVATHQLLTVPNVHNVHLERQV